MEAISIDELRKVKGIGKKTIARIREQLEKEKNYISEYDEAVHLELNQIHTGDCLELMNGIPDKSVDMILADLPYGTTACAWDDIIPFKPLWAQYERVIKDNGAIVLTAGQPFTTALINSNIDLFKYTWVWVKNGVTGFANAKKQPLRNVEDVVVFYKNPPTYNPQGLIRIDKKVKNGVSVGGDSLRGSVEQSAGRGQLRTAGATYTQEYTNYPRQTLEFDSAVNTLHPTQKPVKLFEYLIETYTKPGQIVLDNVIGVGTSAVASINTGRQFIGIELDPVYSDIADTRAKRQHKKKQGGLIE